MKKCQRLLTLMGMVRQQRELLIFWKRFYIDGLFIKRLRLFDIPYITPSVFIAMLLKNGKLTLKEAHKKLDSLSPFVSEDEYNAVKLVLENWRTQ